MAGDQPQSAEINELRRQLAEAESTLSAIRNGEVDALVINGKDIYTLQGADHPYRVLVEAMQQGAVTLAPNGIIVYCNAGFAEMVRKPVDKIIGLPIASLFSPADHVVLADRLADSRTSKLIELMLTVEGEQELPVLVSVNRLPLEGEPAICLVVTDLTDQRRNQQLQDTDRRKDEFLAMLAHELRNPLAPISHAARMLSLWSKDGAADVQGACEVINRQVRQLSRIVDDLLDMSRITRGKINLQTELIDVADIISAAVETSRPLVESRGHTLHVVLPEEELRVEADLTRMAQVVTNLLNNAAKYTEEGGEIWVRVGRDGCDVKIAVRDNGVGMPREMLASVFDLFTQADRTIDRSQGGLGIGLTLVRTLVELHHGSVTVASDGPGRGSEFVVRLPLAVAAQTPGGLKPGGSSNGALPKRQRVLVVDDNVDAARMLALLLKTMGHDSAVSHDGPAALDAVESFRPTLVLLDIGLPEMDGYIVATRMKKLPAMRGVVLAALTGYGEERDRQKSQEAGFDRHFVKPLEMATLQSLIASLPATT